MLCEYNLIPDLHFTIHNNHEIVLLINLFLFIYLLLFFMKDFLLGIFCSKALILHPKALDSLIYRYT